jgi:hypothetical protein
MKSRIPRHIFIRTWRSAAFALPLLVLATAPVAAQTDNEAKFCTERDLRGTCFTVKKGGGSVNLSARGLDNQISSVKVGKNVNVRAFDGTNWTGACILLEGSEGGGTYSALSGNVMSDGNSADNRITSYQVGPKTYKCP